MQNLLDGRLERLDQRLIQCRKRITYDLFLPCFLCQTVTAETPASLLETLQSLLRPLDIFESEFGLDDLHIADRIDVALDVGDLGVIKGTDHLEDPINSANVGQEGISEACSGGGTLGGGIHISKRG